MEADERTAWIGSVAKYIRICANAIDTVVIKTSDGDTVTFNRASKPNAENDESL